MIMSSRFRPTAARKLLEADDLAEGSAFSSWSSQDIGPCSVKKTLYFFLLVFCEAPLRVARNLPFMDRGASGRVTRMAGRKAGMCNGKWPSSGFHRTGFAYTEYQRLIFWVFDYWTSSQDNSQIDDNTSLDALDQVDQAIVTIVFSLATVATNCLLLGSSIHDIIFIF